MSSSEADSGDQRAYLRTKDDCVIEACTTIIPASHCIMLDAVALQERAVDYDIGGAQLKIPSLGDLVLVWCILGGAHDWTVLG